MMRIALFLLTNLAVMVVFGLVLSLTGIQSSSVQGLMIMALLFGFGGSFVSLLMSKWMALRSVGGEVIEQPRNERERWLVNTVETQALAGHIQIKLEVGSMFQQHLQHKTAVITQAGSILSGPLGIKSYVHYFSA